MSRVAKVKKNISPTQAEPRVKLFSARSPLMPAVRLRVFTQSFKGTLPALRLNLKRWSLGVPYGSYDLPFHFDRCKLLSYRVLAAVQNFSFDRNQNKYFLNYDLGTKQPLKLSGRLLLHFRRFHSLGKIIYGRQNLGFFAKTLMSNPDLGLYTPAVSLGNSNYLKRIFSATFYAAHVDVLPLVFKKRFFFHKKLQVQSADLDLAVSGGRKSFGAAFQQAPAPSVFFPVMPMRYHSFIVSSYVNSRRVNFPYRFFRYYHKYLLRRNYWSQRLSTWWNSFTMSLGKLAISFKIFEKAVNGPLATFGRLKFYLVLFFFLATRRILYGARLRSFYSCLFSLSSPAMFFLRSLYSQGAHDFTTQSDFFLNYATHSHSGLLSLKRQSNGPKASFAWQNRLFLSQPWLHMYMTARLHDRMAFPFRYSYYRPGRRRFVSSFRHLSFLRIFLRRRGKTRRKNASGFPKSLKTVFRKDRSVWDFAWKRQRKLIKIVGQFLIMFLRKQSTIRNFFSKLPFFLKYFFKFSKGLFGSGKTYTQQFFASRSTANLFSPKFNPSWKVFYSFLRQGLAKALDRSVYKSRSSLFFKRKIKTKTKFLFRTLYRFLRAFRSASKKSKHFIAQQWWHRFNFFPRTKNYFSRTWWNQRQKATLWNALLPKRFFKLSHWHFSTSLLTTEFSFRFFTQSFKKFAKGKRRRRPFKLYKNLVLLARVLQANRMLLLPWWKSLRLMHRLGRAFKKHFYRKLNVTGLASPGLGYWTNVWLSVFRGCLFYQAFSSKRNFFWRFKFPLVTKGFSAPMLRATDGHFSGYSKYFHKISMPNLSLAFRGFAWKPILAPKLSKIPGLSRRFKRFARQQRFVKFYLRNKGKMKFRKGQLKHVAYSLPRKPNKARRKPWFKAQPKPRWKIDFKYLSAKPKVTKEDLIFALTSKLKD